MRIQITNDNQASTTDSNSSITPPVVLSVTSTRADGAYKAGDTIDIDVVFSKAVTVSSSSGLSLATPTLDLNSNLIPGASAKATYLSGSGTSTLTFRYTVSAGDNTPKLEYPTTTSLQLGGASIQDVNGNSANLTLPAIGGGSSLGSLKNLYIDTIAPQPPSGLTDGMWFYSLIRSPTFTYTSGSDAESGIDHHEVKIQDHSNGDVDLTFYASLISGLYVSGLNLTNGSNYRFVIRTVDKAGNYSSEVISDGWTVDNTAPIAPASIDDGVLAFSATSTPTLSWLVGSDANSGVQSYQIAIGDTSGGNNILDWTDVGNTISAIISTLTLQGSKRFYTSIKTIDAAGGASTAQTSDGWWNLALNKVAVDSTSPTVRMFSASARFGEDSAISEDGSTMVVGAPYDNLDENGGNFINFAGAAFVYVKSGGIWVLQQKLVGTGTNGRMTSDYFGTSVAISGDTIVIGAYGQSYDESGANFVSGAGAAYVFTRSGSVWSLQQKLVAFGTNGRNNDLFGVNVAISGDTIVVGAIGQDYDANGANMLMDAGAAYVFTRTGSIWSPEQKLVGTGSNGRLGNDNFGYSVAISGDTIIVGSYFQSYDASGANFVSSAGAAYVFTRSGSVWSLQQKLVGFGTNGRLSNDLFGCSVAINGDTIIVGSYNQDYDDTGANFLSSAGAAYVFTRSGTVWSSQQKLVGTGVNGRTNFDEFGVSVAISGETIVVGAISQNYDASGANLVTSVGAVYVFTRSGTVWSSQQKLVGNGINSRIAYDQFSYSVAISGDTIVVGAVGQDYDASGANSVTNAGAAFVYSRVTTTWTQDQKLVDSVVPQSRTDLNSDGLGSSIAVSEDGLTMVVGSPYDNTDENGENYLSSSGAAFVYIKSAGNWVLQQKLVGSGTNGRMADDYFGYSVAISGDTIVVGATRQDYDGSGLTYISAAGAAYVFIRTAGVWSLQQKLVGTGTNGRMSNDYFGTSVSISIDTIVVGASTQDYDSVGASAVSNAGAAYVFTRTGTVWSQQQKLVGTGVNGRITNDNFGNSVAISGDNIVVGAFGQDYDDNGANYLDAAGAAYVFTRTGTVWSQQQKLVGTGTNGRLASDMFGCSVAINVDTIVIGAYFNSYDINGANMAATAGAAYVFTRTGTVWSLQQKLVGTGTNGRLASDYFGYSVAISGDTIVVGATQQDYDASGANIITDAGATYVFTRSGTVWTNQQKLVGNGTNGRMASDNFGSSVAVSENGASDGYTIVVGAPNQSYTSTGTNPVSQAGAAFVFY